MQSLSPYENSVTLDNKGGKGQFVNFNNTDNLDIDIILAKYLQDFQRL